MPTDQYNLPKVGKCKIKGLLKKVEALLACIKMSTSQEKDPNNNQKNKKETKNQQMSEKNLNKLSML